jgi:FkbM family methyltransferase
VGFWGGNGVGLRLVGGGDTVDFLEFFAMDASSYFLEGELDLVQYPLVLEGKAPKRIYAPKGDFIGELFRSARPWEYGFLVNTYRRAERGGAFLEIGANIGSDTLIACDYFQKCYAIEPSSRNRELFLKNMKLNGVNNVELMPYAIGNQSGMAKLYLGAKNNAGGSALLPNHPGMTQWEEVKVLTLDEAMPLGIEDVTFIHIDTEGHDIKVLQGSKGFLARQKQRPLIRMEFQPRTLAAHGSSVAELIGFIDEMKYRPMFDASKNWVPLSYGILMEMFYLWKMTDGWIDLVLMP